MNHQEFENHVVPKLTQALKSLPEMAAPSSIETFVMAAIAKSEHQSSETNSHRWVSFLTVGLVALGTPLWVYLSIKAQHCMLSQLIWKLITINDNIDWLNLLFQWIHAMPTSISVVAAIAVAAAVSVYIGLARILILMTQNIAPKGTSI